MSTCTTLRMIIPNHTTEDGGESDHEVIRFLTAIAVSSDHAYGPKPLFGSCDCCALSARTLYCLGGLRSLAHAIASHPSLAAYRFPDLGDSHGGNALALPFNTPRELAGTKGGSRAIPRRLPAPLYGQAGVSGYFRNGADSGGSARLRLQLGDLCQPSLESQPSQPTADLSLVARILVIEVAFEEPFFSWDHNHRNDANSRNERYQQPSVVQPNGQSEYE
jgi:hypothetical protein